MFYIHPEEQPLIEAAIRLGEWFIANPDLADEDRKKVLSVVESIKRLPSVTLGASGSFGFGYADDSVVSWHGTGAVPIGTCEYWEVSYYPIPGSPENLSKEQIWLEIFNVRSTYPHCQDDLYDMQFELDF